MPTRTYTRKTDPTGLPADPAKGDPSFQAGILTALPGRTWRTNAGTEVVVDIDGTDLTPQEDADLTAAHTAWAPTASEAYAPTYEVTTVVRGLVQKVEWFQTDAGDGTYEDLAKDAQYLWHDSILLSITYRRYAIDGSVLETWIEAFYTTDDGKRVVKGA